MINNRIFKSNINHLSGVISNQIVDTLDFGFDTFDQQVVVENCIIDTLILHNAHFVGGLCLQNCIIKNKVQYEMGGYNKMPIVIKNNIFMSLFVFLDCIFGADLVLTDNIFLDGCTLYNGYNEFDNVIVENNIGKMDDERWD
ncbi:hypothetical protein [Xylanibacter ruminicola]|uniref:Pentapeptide repeat-containing protein n=1 Tax=Xylanibacter ruminicola TaxID=839 RepID=A0A1M6SRX6_XYLRU|nr:hypothetical protein [Xylanibacter ruminicola]SHK47390.1 hypothetical protein SAMN05216463_1042 [Xylanibacter ruminicola]